MRKLGLIALCAFALSSAADATTYYLKNVKFDDGTSASGFFATNVSDYPDGRNIVTQTGAITGYNYTDAINASYSPRRQRLHGLS